MSEIKRFSAEWVQSEVRRTGAYQLDHHDCGMCGVLVFYGFNPPDTKPEVFFRSACGCSWSPDRPSNWQEIADWLAMQSKDEIRERIWRGLQVPSPTP